MANAKEQIDEVLNIAKYGVDNDCSKQEINDYADRLEVLFGDIHDQIYKHKFNDNAEYHVDQLHSFIGLARMIFGLENPSGYSKVEMYERAQHFGFKLRGNFSDPAKPTE